MDEQWKEVGIAKYMISNYGNVKGRTGEKPMIPRVVGSGHHQICFIDDKIGKQFYIHRLVALHFLQKPDDENKCIIDHIDRNKTNNHVSNLRWVTHRENSNNRYDSREQTEKILKQNEKCRLYCLNNRDKIIEYRTNYTKSGKKSKQQKTEREKSKQLFKTKDNINI